MMTKNSDIIGCGIGDYERWKADNSEMLANWPPDLSSLFVKTAGLILENRSKT